MYSGNIIVFFQETECSCESTKFLINFTLFASSHTTIPNILLEPFNLAIT